MGWYRKLIADKYNSVAPGQKKRGRPSISPEDEAAIYVKDQLSRLGILQTQNLSAPRNQLRESTMTFCQKPSRRQKRKAPSVGHMALILERVVEVANRFQRHSL